MIIARRVVALLGLCLAACGTSPAAELLTAETEAEATPRHEEGAQEMLFKKKPGLLEPGTTAPEFSLTDQDGQTVQLADFRGRRLLLWFYPKAATPG
jgi:cytochrome oxidase Cu insertion factor (SCO1/SenC/PrrC family)